MALVVLLTLAIVTQSGVSMLRTASGCRRSDAGAQEFYRRRVPACLVRCLSLPARRYLGLAAGQSVPGVPMYLGLIWLLGLALWLESRAGAIAVLARNTTVADTLVVAQIQGSAKERRLRNRGSQGHTRLRVVLVLENPNPTRERGAIGVGYRSPGAF